MTDNNIEHGAGVLPESAMSKRTTETAQVAQRSANHIAECTIECPTCRGTGVLPGNGDDCPACDSKGGLRVAVIEPVRWRR